MKFTSINHAFMLVGVMLMILFGVGTGTGIWAVIHLSADIAEMTRSAQIIRSNMIADMNHDALRADVLMALQSQTPSSPISLERVRSDTAEHTKNFKAAIDENLARSTNLLIHEALVEVQSPLQDYISAAETLVATAAVDPLKAQSELKPFMDKFYALETKMAETSDRIQTLIDADTARSNEMVKQAQILTTAMLVIGLGVCFLLITVARSYLVTPLVRVTGVVDRLAKGDYEVAVPTTARTDEIGLLTRALSVFKQVISDRASEVEAAEQRAMLEKERQENEDRRIAAEKKQIQMVDSIGSGLERLSNGDLTAHLAEPFAPEYERLRTDFNATIVRLEKTIQAVVTTTHGMHNGSEEISRASDDLSRRTEQQAASLEQTAAALDQITTTVRKTAEGAAEASAVVAKAAVEAEEGGGVVRRAVEAMSEIEKSANQISQIIGVIDEIAFQTNLLALNAGVEAARAGDAGKGFAVVASEVRALAQRSAEAAKEIKALISASSRQVGQGVDLVAKTGAALERIMQMVAGMNTLVTEIAASAKEQATSLHEVNSSVNQMDQVTQQNAAMVEETTAASHSLASEATSLVQLVAQFRVSTPDLAAVPRAGQAPRTIYSALGRSGSATLRKPAAQAVIDEWQEF